MPHPQRFDQPGARHHVWNRGASQRTVAEHRSEARFFLACLVKEVRAGRIYLLSFVILTNHFHLHLESRTGELSRVLQRVLSPHVRRFNHPRDRSGALFSGRFKSRLVHSERDGQGLNAYIHGNPVKAGMEKSPEDHEFSSAYYLGEDQRVPIWLRKAWEAHPGARPTLAAPAGAATWRVLEARASAPCGREDPIEDLLGASPRHIREWFRQRALIADQRSLLLPVADPVAVLAVCDAEEQRTPCWPANPTGKRTRPAWPLARVAVLRETCGLRWHEIAERLRMSISGARRLHVAHGQCMLADPVYPERFALLATLCIGATEL